MKKAGLLIIALLILPLILQLVLAQEEVPGLPSTLQPGNIEKTGEKIDETAGKIEDVENKLTDEEARNQYLKQEWDKILLENKYVGSIYGFTKGVLVFLNPFFKVILGIEYSFSWAFFLALLLFIAFFIIAYIPFKNYILVEYQTLAIIAGLIVASLISLSAMKKIISLLGLILINIYYTMIFALAAILLLLLYAIINKKFGAKLKAEMKKAAEERRERKAKTIEKIHDIELKATGIGKP